MGNVMIAQMLRVGSENGLAALILNEEGELHVHIVVAVSLNLEYVMV